MCHGGRQCRRYHPRIINRHRSHSCHLTRATERLSFTEWVRYNCVQLALLTRIGSGPMYAPLARRLSPDYYDRLPDLCHEWDAATTPSPLLLDALLAPVHVWTLRPLHPHIDPTALCCPMRGLAVAQLPVHRVDNPQQINRSSQAPMVVAFLEATPLDRMNFYIPAMLSDCPNPSRTSCNNAREPLRGDLLALRLLMKKKMGRVLTQRS